MRQEMKMKMETTSWSKSIDNIFEDLYERNHNHFAQDPLNGNNSLESEFSD